MDGLRTREEANIMCEYAHERMNDPYWQGVKSALFWMMKAIDDEYLKNYTSNNSPVKTGDGI